MDIDIKLGIKEKCFKKDTLLERRRKDYDAYKTSIEKGKITNRTEFNIGDEVLVYRNNISDKLKSSWHTGYVVTDRILPDAYCVKRGKQFLRANKNQLKLDTSQ